MTNPQLSIVLVNYNTKDDCIRCIQSIRERITGMTCEVIVCDNGSSDDSIGAIKGQFPPEQFPWVRVIDNKANLGFGRANNIGAAQASADVLLFLNPDTVIDRGIEDMYHYLLAHEDVGVLGPAVIDHDGKPNVFYPPVYGSMVMQMADLLITPLARLIMTSRKLTYRRHMARRRAFNAKGIIGCAMMFTRDAFNAVNGFDEGIFMYGEEFDICTRLRDTGYWVRVFPEATIVHFGGHSSVQTPPDSIVTIGARSLKRLLSRHFPHSWRIRYTIEALTHIRQALSACTKAAFDFLAGKSTAAHLLYMRNHVRLFKVMRRVLKEKDVPPEQAR